MVSIKYDILSIQERANKALKDGKDVINGCAGMLFSDNKSLVTYDLINQKIASSFTSYLGYPSILGSKEYEDGVLHWIFNENLIEIKNKYHISFATTIGGTGAISMLFNYFSKNNGVGLISDIYWPNYKNIAEIENLELYSHLLINKNNGFNLVSLERKLKELVNKNYKVLVIINDPCQNPTGFCLTNEEYIQLFNILNKYYQNVSLMMDIAYLDYAPMGFIFPKVFLESNIKFDTYLTFSASKSFGIYGMRLGALIGLVHNQEKVHKQEEDFKAFSRSIYSCPNNSAMGPISEVLNDQDLCFKLRQDINKQRNRLENIGNLLSKALDDLKIPHFPYTGGFYLTFFVDDALDFCKALEEKNIYFSPIGKNRIRIAVSSLCEKDILKLKRRLS